MVQIIREDSIASGANYAVQKGMFKESREKSHCGPVASKKAHTEDIGDGPNWDSSIDTGNPSGVWVLKCAGLYMGTDNLKDKELKGKCLQKKEHTVRAT